MKLDEMTGPEQRALAGLVRLIVGADREFSSEEAEELSELAADLGDEQEFWGLIEAENLRDHTPEQLRELARGVTRKDAQETIYGVLFAIATIGTIDRTESDLLDWLAAEWKLEVKPVDGPEADDADED